MDILLTFAGNRDPFNPEAVQGGYTDGPVLTLLKERTFAFIYILTTPNTVANARNLQEEIVRRGEGDGDRDGEKGGARTGSGSGRGDGYNSKGGGNNGNAPAFAADSISNPAPGPIPIQIPIPIKILLIDIPDPTDYEALYLHMFRHCREIMAAHAHDQPHYFIATPSGTPQMQTIWFLLAQSGAVPATLLKITPPRFLRPQQPAVSEIRLALASFPSLPWPSEQDLDTASLLLRKEKLEAERGEILREFGSLRLIGKSPALTTMVDTIQAVSQYDAAVLIQGETGTGKEIVARAIHFNSPRKMEPFIVINCAAIPESLVESELFGHEKGAFTGAIQQKKGKFELASGGSIFLDEIGDMPLPAQAKILRTIQDGEITRVGGVRPIQTDVRVLAATNRNLAALIGENKFREDLYYRLKVIDIRLPALRERQEDIPLLVDHFLSRHNHRWRQQKQLSREAMHRIVAYSWPGNIRELENAIERSFILAKGSVIRAEDLPPELSAPASMPNSMQAAMKGSDVRQSIPMNQAESQQSPASPISPELQRLLKSQRELESNRYSEVPGPLSSQLPTTESLSLLSTLQAPSVVIPPDGMDLAQRLHDLEKTCFAAAIRQTSGNREAAAKLLGIQPHTFRKRAKEKFGL
jgi:DNA-binding NtrC family response regulator